jgi:hypothetical protein
VEKTRLLQQLPLFQDLRSGDLKSIAEIAAEVKYKAHQQNRIRGGSSAKERA